MDDRRIGTNDSYYEACRKLADIAIRTDRYYASAHQPCITEQEIVEKEECYWQRKNLINKTLGYHICDGKNYLSDLKKRRNQIMRSTNWFRKECEIEEIDRKLYEFQCKEREQWFRDRWTRWSVRVEDFKLEFGYRPIVANWEYLRNKALKFIEDI